MGDTTGAKPIEEIFTFQANTTLTDLSAPPEQDLWYPRPCTAIVSFNHGLLANVHNSFAMRVLPNITGIYIYYSSNLASDFDPLGVYVTKMNLMIGSISKLSSGGTRFHTRENMSMIAAEQPLETRSGMGNRYQKYFYLDSTSLERCRNGWDSQANALSIAVTVSKHPAVANSVNAEVYKPDATKNPPYLLDMRKYFLSSKFSDLSIRCEEENFAVHILVLSHHSPVFAKMFAHDMKESKEKLVEIKDADSNVVREMLRYFYTGEIENLSAIGFQLYQLADKYLIDHLKEVCMRSLCQNVHLENAQDMYCLGRERGIDVLVQNAETVLIANKKELFKNLTQFQALLNAVPLPIAEDLFKLLWNIS